MIAGVREIIIIADPKALPLSREILGSGAQWGIQICYAAQPKPEGLAQALLISRDFVDGCKFALALGDNLFYGAGFGAQLRSAASFGHGAVIFAYHVADPRSFGVVQLDNAGLPVALEEKHTRPKSNLAVTGLSFYNKFAASISSTLMPSKLVELEISHLNDVYLQRGDLRVEQLPR